MFIFYLFRLFILIAEQRCESKVSQQKNIAKSFKIKLFFPSAS